ncbi:hypothetical protein Syun_008353 [Stephania yunnanensis]|uniref:SLC26A/SulP transporter domain-containing protein n=1 Tax=Stephania yunnanensis TaxID=152371 RepID=A0AAP0KEI4_9MAGN
MSSKGGSLSAIYPGRDREMKELGIRLPGEFEDDQEGVRIMDDDNFIDDTGVDPGRPHGKDNEGFIGMRHTENGHGTRDVVPPLIYAIMGSSREIAIGPVAVVSLLVSSMVQNVVDPSIDPLAYRRFVFTVTCFAGIFQAAFGLLLENSIFLS